MGIQARFLQIFEILLKAKYALLYSIALDKNYIDISSDSIINVALDYYKNMKLSTYRMKSYYYKGRVCFNAKLYPQANIYFNLAEQDASNLSDNLYLGLIYGEMMRVFNISYNFKEELSYAIKSYESYVESKSINHIMYSLLDIGISYFNQKNFTKALLFNVYFLKYRYTLHMPCPGVKNISFIPVLGH